MRRESMGGIGEGGRTRRSEGGEAGQGGREDWEDSEGGIGGIGATRVKGVEEEWDGVQVVVGWSIGRKGGGTVRGAMGAMGGMGGNTRRDGT